MCATARTHDRQTDILTLCFTSSFRATEHASLTGAVIARPKETLMKKGWVMTPNLGKAAVLGAGTMGATIAAHLANAGIPTLLLDIAPRELTPEERMKLIKKLPRPPAE